MVQVLRPQFASPCFKLAGLQNTIQISSKFSKLQVFRSIFSINLSLKRISCLKKDMKLKKNWCFKCHYNNKKQLLQELNFNMTDLIKMQLLNQKKLFIILGILVVFVQNYRFFQNFLNSSLLFYLNSQVSGTSRITGFLTTMTTIL